MHPGCRIPSVVLVSSLVALSFCSAALADPVELKPVLLPYDESANKCTPPEGRNASIGFSRDNSRDFVTGIGQGLEKAAKDRGLSYSETNANSDAAKQVTDVTKLIAAGTGAVIATPVDPRVMTPQLLKLIEAGSYVGSIVAPPATTLVNAPQYRTGQTLAEEAAKYIASALGGRANVVLLTHDSLQFLASRFVAMRDVFKDNPDVRIVADISPAEVSEAGGYETMKLILAANTRVDVVLGADAVVLGALRALREAGKDRADQFLGGIDGDPEAVEEIRRGGAYKASVALSPPVFGYALGWFAADWLEGKSVPQAVDIQPFALNSRNMDRYEADLADPGAVFRDPERRRTYLSFYGNICAVTADNYLDYPWSSEGS
jgi:ribose transport system substrate-binding protein